MKKFQIPEFYRSPLLSTIKNYRKNIDGKKKDFTPTELDFGPVRFIIARHFGFCYGVENAIEIAFQAIAENPQKRIFLLSQMIHNPIVNKDLLERGIKFILDTNGKNLIQWEQLDSHDLVIIPAFGTTLEIQNKLTNIGIEVHQYNTTCPFVEKVWNKANKLGEDTYTLIIHGKHDHEETKATFSRSEKAAPTLILKNIEEAAILASIIENDDAEKHFEKYFSGRCSIGFDPKLHLKRIGVINQTTMLASETKAITNILKNALIERFGKENIPDHFADTRDTLCYATNENQESTFALLNENADMALVVGGYNSSNTSHLVELCEEKLKTYYISSEDEIINQFCIRHFNYSLNKMEETRDFLPNKEKINIILTSGASCPDAILEAIIDKILSFFPTALSKEAIIKKFV